MDPTTVIKVSNEPILREQLVEHVGFVADLTLTHEARISGVIVAVALDAVILEIWDSSISGLNGDLAVVALNRVSQICIQ